MSDDIAIENVSIPSTDEDNDDIVDDENLASIDDEIITTTKTVSAIKTSTKKKTWGDYFGIVIGIGVVVALIFILYIARGKLF